MSALTPVAVSRRPAPQPRLSAPYVPGRRSKRFWTEAETDILRAHYPTGGAAACALKLPGRSRAKIRAKANALGLHTVKQALPRQRRSAEAVAALDAKIKEAWPTLAGRGAVQALADRLGVARWSLSKRALALGLTMPHKKEPPWTAAETALMSRVPLHDPVGASRIFRDHGFRRTPTAIVVCAKRLDLSRRRADVFSATGVAKLLGIDGKVVTGWCIAGTLKAEKRGTNRLPQQGGDTWSIAPADLRRFILDNLERIDLRKVEKFGFVALVANEESSA
jgi:hypothetical protein